MALRTSDTLLGTFVRAGVFCLGTGRTCVAHGLPETPDSICFTPYKAGEAASCFGYFLESWNSVSVVFLASYATPGYMRLAVEHSRIR